MLQIVAGGAIAAFQFRRSLASPTRSTFHPYAMNLVAMSSENATEVDPSMVISLVS